MCDGRGRKNEGECHVRQNSADLCAPSQEQVEMKSDGGEVEGNNILGSVAKVVYHDHK
jgi:hypothetical protein